MIDQFFIGEPYNYKNLCTVYPPTVKDVCTSALFNAFCALLLISEEEVEDELAKKDQDGEKIELKDFTMTPFEYMLNLVYNNIEVRAIVNEGFKFFIHEPVVFLYDSKQIIIGDVKKELMSNKKLEDFRIITEDDWFDFQNVLRQAAGLKPKEPYVPDEDPRVRRIKAKGRYRDKIKAKQKGLNFFSMMASFCCMNLNISPLNIGELSYSAFKALFQYAQAKKAYELQIDQVLSMAVDSKDLKPENWIKNFENLD